MVHLLYRTQSWPTEPEAIQDKGKGSNQFYW